MARVFLSVGSNLGDRLAHLRSAVERLSGLAGVRFVEASPLYQTEPWELRPGITPEREMWFYNCVVEVETTLPPSTLLGHLQEIERLEGRVPETGTHEDRRYQPRSLDIDILLYGDQVISAPEDLQVPHLLMHERAFVLRPLADLVPDLEHPILYRTIRELLDLLEDEHQVLLADLPARWFDR